MSRLFTGFASSSLQPGGAGASGKCWAKGTRQGPDSRYHGTNLGVRGVHLVLLVSSVQILSGHEGGRHFHGETGRDEKLADPLPSFQRVHATSLREGPHLSLLLWKLSMEESLQLEVALCVCGWRLV